MNERSDNREPSVLDALPGLARAATGAWLHSAVRGVDATLRLGGRLARAAVSPDAAAQLANDFGHGVRGYARELLGVSDLDERVRQLMPSSGVQGVASARSRTPEHPDLRQASRSLREQGAELLRESANVDSEEKVHPAYEQILSELAPDEGRILRLLVAAGPQPAVNVRSANLVGLRSKLVAPGLNMIAAQAGCRYVERIAAYLNNLYRLGLISFSEEPLDDPARYQVLEAQPEALAAIKRAGHVKTVHRSIRLTPFGQDFCDVCLPPATGEIESLGAEDS